MLRKNTHAKLTRVVGETIKLPEKSGNGTLKILVSADTQGVLRRYSLAYINHRICNADNGRVVGYDNSHGYHHRHYMGEEEAIEFTSYEKIAERFEKEWRMIHEKAKKRHH